MKMAARINKIEALLKPSTKSGRVYDELEEWEKALYFIGSTQWSALTWPGCEIYNKLFKELGEEVTDCFDGQTDRILKEARQRGYSFFEENIEDIEIVANIPEVLQWVNPEYHNNLREVLMLKYKKTDASLNGRIPKGCYFKIKDGKVSGTKFVDNGCITMNDQETKEILG